MPQLKQHHARMGMVSRAAVIHDMHSSRHCSRCATALSNLYVLRRLTPLPRCQVRRARHPGQRRHVVPQVNGRPEQPPVSHLAVTWQPPGRGALGARPRQAADAPSRHGCGSHDPVSLVDAITSHPACAAALSACRQRVAWASPLPASPSHPSLDMLCCLLATHLGPPSLVGAPISLPPSPSTGLAMCTCKRACNPIPPAAPNVPL